MIYAFKYITGKKDHRAVSATEIVEVQKQELPEDFVEFYKRFHSDSIFQKQHIVFPLNGIKKDSTGNVAYLWESADWKTHHNLHGFPDYRIYYSVLDDEIHEYVEDHSGTFRMKRTFLNSGGAWNLSFYEEMGYADPTSLSD